MNCAVFASGGGTNFQSLIDRRESGDLHLNFSLLVCNNSTAGAIERATRHAIPYLHLAPSHFASEEEYTATLLAELDKHRVELIVLAGYMKHIPAAVIRRFPNRIVNIHPALLPAFGGKGLFGNRVHQAVLDYGAKVTGVSVHFVDEEYDHGPIILQETVPVLDNDDATSLAARVLRVEHAVYWRAIEALCRGSLSVNDRRVSGAV
jgi:phosphoribosylglycinamide formyltransferase-1